MGLQTPCIGLVDFPTGWAACGDVLCRTLDLSRSAIGETVPGLAALDGIPACHSCGWRAPGNPAG
eukprot:10312864-Lingulodinium_polyedra.AAC.1